MASRSTTSSIAFAGRRRADLRQLEGVDRFHVRRDLPRDGRNGRTSPSQRRWRTLLDEDQQSTGADWQQIKTDEGASSFRPPMIRARNVTTHVSYPRRHPRRSSPGRHHRVIRNVEECRPLTWKDNGGTCGRVASSAASFIVTRTPAVPALIPGRSLSIGSSSSQAFLCVGRPTPRGRRTLTAAQSRRRCFHDRSFRNDEQ